MVQEFKQFDKKYSAFKGKLLEYEHTSNLSLHDLVNFESWQLPVGSYTNAEIREAVYFADGAEEWQKFRVSQKGFNTKQKLARLAFRYAYFHCAGSDTYDEMAKLEKLRIDNYLGALVRGGQLSTDLKVQR